MKKTFVLIIILLTIFSMSFCNKGTGSGEEKVIKVGIVTWGGYIAGITANGGKAKTQAGSIYDKLGIKVEFIVIDDVEKCRSAFRSGTINVMWGTVDSFALEYPSLKQFKPVAILQNDWSRGGDAIAVTKSIKTAADLKGKKIAVAEGTPSHFFALHVLNKAGLNYQDVTWVFTKSAIDAANIFKSGSVDACVSWAPDVYVAAKAVEGGKILTSTKEEKFLIADILISKLDFINKNKELVKKFVKGWMQGVVAATGNIEQSINYLTSTVSKIFTGVDAGLAKTMIEAIYLPTLQDNKNFFNQNGEGMTYYKLYKSAEKIWMSIKKLKKQTDPSVSVMPELFDFSLE